MSTDLSLQEKYAKMLSFHVALKWDSSDKVLGYILNIASPLQMRENCHDMTVVYVINVRKYRTVKIWIYLSICIFWDYPFRFLWMCMYEPLYSCSYTLYRIMLKQSEWSWQYGFVLCGSSGKNICIRHEHRSLNNEQWSNFCGDAMAVAFFEAIRNRCFLTHVTIASDTVYHWTWPSETLFFNVMVFHNFL